ADVLGELLGGFLESQEDARFAELQGPADEELQGQQGLAEAGGAANERGPAAGQAAAGDLVEPGDAGGALGQGPLGEPVGLSVLVHRPGSRARGRQRRGPSWVAGVGCRRKSVPLFALLNPTTISRMLPLREASGVPRALASGAGVMAAGPKHGYSRKLS